MKSRLTLLGLALAGCAAAQPLMIVDYDNQLQAANPPVVGSRFWLSDVWTGRSGQNRNVGRYDSANSIWTTSTAATSTSKVVDPATFTAETGQFTASNSQELKFAFIGEDTNNPPGANRGLARATMLRAYGQATSPVSIANPVLDTSVPIRIDIWTAEPIRVALMITDGEQLNPVGSAGTTPVAPALLGYEVIGGPTGTPDALVADANITGNFTAYGGYVLPAGKWTTVTFDLSDPANYTVLNYLQGDGLLNPVTPNRIALSSLLFTPIDGEGARQVQHNIFIDNFRNGAETDGDANLDGVVNLDDFLMLASAYETSNTDPNYNPAADFNDSGNVDLDDFLILATNYEG